jgi:WhiB family redox-sensing transcriptional regulator
MKRPLVIQQALAGDLSVLERDIEFPSFFADAECADIDNPDIFFSEFEREITEAKKLCYACPVQAMCLSWAVNQNADGVYGGKTNSEREKLSSIGNNFDAQAIAQMQNEEAMIFSADVKQAMAHFKVTERTIYRWRIILDETRKAG